MKLHSGLDQWFRARHGRWSPAQRLALPHTLAGRNTLILAPTGSGKTLAAFLSILHGLASRGPLPNQTLAVYISPLRSLTRDIERNLREPLASLGMEARMDVRTGDTEAVERTRQSRRHPHLLLTTPESLSALLSQNAWKDGFAVDTVVVDEIHAFAESKRGSLLALTLERLNPAQRIGLSATAHPAGTVVKLLCGMRPCAVVQPGTAKSYELEIANLPETLNLPPAGYAPNRIAWVVADYLRRARCSLVFTATRSSAEQLGLALKVLLPEWEDRIAVHHGSLDREDRLRIEEELSQGKLVAAVCSTSLEMGVDFQPVDQVLLIGAPRGVSRTLQRLGRSGHRLNGVARGVLVPLSLPDLAECVALREAVRGGRLDSLRMPCAPLDVLAQVLLGMSVERPWGVDEAYELVTRAGPYLDLKRQDFDDVLAFLAGSGRVLSGYGGTYGRIVLENGVFRAASRQSAQRYYRNIGTISDDYQVKVIGRGNRQLGRVEESFLAELAPGEAFVLGGRSVRVRTLQGDTATVEPAEGERVKTPRWMGGRMSLTARLAEEVRHLRAALRDHAADSGQLAARYNVTPDIAGRLCEYAARQQRASAVPAESPVVAEAVASGRARLMVVHSVAGRSVNRSLVWVIAARLGAASGSIASGFDDHAFFLSFAAAAAPPFDRLRECLVPDGFEADLRRALEATELLGRRFRPVAETAQLMERRTVRGPAQRRMSSWNGALLYQTLLKYEPDHPLLREAVREVLQDELDASRAAQEAARLHSASWECYSLDRPSPFSLPLLAGHNREVLLAQQPDLALEEITAQLFDTWGKAQ
jgi:ATP-dependent Lhr-like helicase